jgi:hypothetical protein
VTCNGREIGGREDGEHFSSSKEALDEDVGKKMRGNNF